MNFGSVSQLNGGGVEVAVVKRNVKIAVVIITTPHKPTDVANRQVIGSSSVMVHKGERRAHGVADGDGVCENVEE